MCIRNGPFKTSGANLAGWLIKAKLSCNLKSRPDILVTTFAIKELSESQLIYLYICKCRFNTAMCIHKIV